VLENSTESDFRKRGVGRPVKQCAILVFTSPALGLSEHSSTPKAGRFLNRIVSAAGIARTSFSAAGTLLRLELTAAPTVDWKDVTDTARKSVPVE
jgi:hypothetical protein